MAIWYILWPFGIFYGYLVRFLRFGMFCQDKSGNLVRPSDDGDQGDQMSFLKNRPKYCPTHFFSELIHKFFPKKRVAQNFGLFLKFSKTAQ
jgi:hypothetical protein